MRKREQSTMSRVIPGNISESLKCNICDKSFNSKISIERHRQTVHITNTSKCKDCGKTYSNRKALSDHKNYVHTNFQKLSCNLCGKKFNALHHLQIHTEGVHLLKRWKCDDCEKDFSTKAGLTKHKATIHCNETQGKIPCTLCGSTFTRKDSHRKHMREFHENEAKEHSCQFCNKSFSIVRYLKAHERQKHGSQKIFQCQLCTKSFSRKDYLQEHNKGVHLGITYKCEICDEAFKGRTYMKKHMEIKHNDGLKNYKCDVCEQSFALERYLKSHKLIHTKNSRDCELCGKTFTVHTIKSHINKKQCVKLRNQS